MTLRLYIVVLFSKKYLYKQFKIRTSYVLRIGKIFVGTVKVIRQQFRIVKVNKSIPVQMYSLLLLYDFFFFFFFAFKAF